MKVVSLCAGIGITDMCFVMNNFQILVANDICPKKLAVYKYNHDFEDASFNASIINGDIALSHVQEEIIHAAKAKLAPEEELDLITMFLAPAKNLPKLIAAMQHIAIELKVKMIYIDALFPKGYLNFNFNLDKLINLDKYSVFSAKHQLEHYGVSSKTNRKPYFLFAEKHFSEQISIIKSRITARSEIKAKTLNELFTPIQIIESKLEENGLSCGLIKDTGKISGLASSQYILKNKELSYFNKQKNILENITKDETLLKEINEFFKHDFNDNKIDKLSEKQREKITFLTDHAHNIIPLHGPTIKNSSEATFILKEKINNLKPGDRLFKRGQSKAIDGRILGSTSAIRANGNEILPLTLSSRADEGWTWMIHPTKHREFTLLELCFIATLHLIPFELAPNAEGRFLIQSTIVRRIADATPPMYLIKIIQDILIPLLKLTKPSIINSSKFKTPEKYSSALVGDEKYYLSSCFSFRQSRSRAADLLGAFGGKVDKRVEKFNNYRLYLLQSIKNYSENFQVSEKKSIT